MAHPRAPGPAVSAALGSPAGARVTLIFILLFLLYMFDYIDRQVVTSLFPFLKTDLGISDTQAGLLVSAVYWSIVVFVFPISVLIDRWSRRISAGAFRHDGRGAGRWIGVLGPQRLDLHQGVHCTTVDWSDMAASAGRTDRCKALVMGGHSTRREADSRPRPAGITGIGGLERPQSGIWTRP